MCFIYVITNVRNFSGSYFSSLLYPPGHWIIPGSKHRFSVDSNDPVIQLSSDCVIFPIPSLANVVNFLRWFKCNKF